jgi:Uma2 family endonuclease
MKITSFSQLDLTKQYTYADYLAWQFEERVELLKGWIVRMASPSHAHQFTASRLFRYIDRHFEAHACNVYFAPTDVMFLDKTKTAQKNKNIYTVLIPDLFVVCDLKKMEDGGCFGAPDLVVEILSPSNTKKEMKYKYEIYEENGVKEYWVVHPIEKYAVVHTLGTDDKYHASRYFTDEDALQSVLFPDLSVDLSKVFLND